MTPILYIFILLFEQYSMMPVFHGGHDVHEIHHYEPQSPNCVIDPITGPHQGC